MSYHDEEERLLREREDAIALAYEGIMIRIQKGDRETVNALFDWLGEEPGRAAEFFREAYRASGRMPVTTLMREGRWPLLGDLFHQWAEALAAEEVDREDREREYDPCDLFI